MGYLVVELVEAPSAGFRNALYISILRPIEPFFLLIVKFKHWQPRIQMLISFHYKFDTYSRKGIFL